MTMVTHGYICYYMFKAELSWGQGGPWPPLSNLGVFGRDLDSSRNIVDPYSLSKMFFSTESESLCETIWLAHEFLKLELELRETIFWVFLWTSMRIGISSKRYFLKHLSVAFGRTENISTKSTLNLYWINSNFGAIYKCLELNIGWLNNNFDIICV